jgi:hypothetical protein
MQSDYLAFQVLSQHIAKMVQSHPQVPLQTLIVRHSELYYFSCADCLSSIFWYLIRDFLWTGVVVANGCFRLKAMFLRLGGYGFLEAPSKLLMSMRAKQMNLTPVFLSIQMLLPRGVNLRIIPMSDVGSHVMLHVCTIDSI